MLSKEELVKGVLSGDRRILGKAITLIESNKVEHRRMAEDVLRELLPHTGRSVRVGITGVPGAGKSTFIESFGLVAIEKGHKVAVLAVDPSSTRNGGSILGDKTRMEELSKEKNAFIRPSPSGGFLGGVANSTFESMLLLEAAGYDYVLIETVGVGQSEVMVSEICDVFLLIKILGSGDELQGIKRGIMEMVDLIFINKVEESNLAQAKQTKLELLRALYFMPPKEEGWKIPVLMGSALNSEGLEAIYESITQFTQLKKEHGTFNLNRELQAEKRFEYWVQKYIMQSAFQNLSLRESYEQHRDSSKNLSSLPMAEARDFAEKLLKK